MPTTSVNYTNPLQFNMPESCGIPQSALNGVSTRYIVKITATLGKAFLGTGTDVQTGQNTLGQNEFTIYGFLQDKIQLSAMSNWEGLTQDIPGDIQNIMKAVETAGQAFLGRTSITPLSTRRKWAGSQPIGIRMKLKFEAFSDPMTEVIQPCIGLQGLTLPRGGLLNTFGLIPPGPNPFDISPKGEPTMERGESISIDIGGGFLKFDSVIIKSVNVTFENRMSDVGPIGAEVDIDIETYQMLTREDLLGSVGNNPMVVRDETGSVSIVQGKNLGQGAF